VERVQRRQPPWRPVSHTQARCGAPRQRSHENNHLVYGTFQECLGRAVEGSSVADPNPDPPDPHVFEPPGSESGSIIQGSGSGSFYH
jgi:hypothetical protein